MKGRLIKVIAVTIPMLAVCASVEAATMYESSNGVSVGGSGVGGVHGVISITSPKINTANLQGHRDYMVYVYLQDGDAANSATIGAGWIAWKEIINNNGRIIEIMRKASLVYINEEDRFPAAVHNIRLDVSSTSSITADITQNTSNRNCWIATTYGQTYNWCFDPKFTKGFAAASIGGSRESYTRNVSDMPGRFDILMFYDNNSGSWKYFSQSGNYKCNTTGGYVLDHLAKYSNAPGNNQIDKVGIGPSLYYTDDCSYDSSVWSPYHAPGEP